MKDLVLDFQSVTGKMKPMHGVNSGPVTCNFRYDATEYFKEAGIPFSRLHDTEYPFGCGQFVDVNCVFPNFDRDVEDPTAYNFALTDEYLRCIVESGTKIIYRMGCTIEHQTTKRYIFPPKDYLKWAKICEHIIRHYNEGWADGYEWGIEYWEIWNEPDGILWDAPKDTFYDFFKVAIVHLKGQFPHLKFGGPALCVGSNEFSEKMLDYLANGEERVPLDFYSWHTYANTPEEVIRNADLAHEVLVKYGYTETESILDEWNYVTKNTWEEVGDAWEVIQSLKGAIFNAAVMIDLQNSTCDIATYYDAQLTFHKWWCGLFGRGASDTFFDGAEPVVAKKGYYPFKAFGALYRLGNQVKAETESGTVHVLAASDGAHHAVLMANYSDEEGETEVLVPKIAGENPGLSKLYLLDEKHDLELVQVFEGVPEQLVIKPNTVLFWEF